MGLEYEIKLTLKNVIDSWHNAFAHSATGSTEWNEMVRRDCMKQDFEYNMTTISSRITLLMSLFVPKDSVKDLCGFDISITSKNVFKQKMNSDAVLP